MRPWSRYPTGTAAVALLVVVGEALAQGAQPTAAAMIADRLTGTRTVPPPREDKALPAVVIPVSATMLSVVSVPVPDAFGPGEPIDFVVTPLLSGAIVGRLTGTVPVGDASRAVLFAVRAPRRLAAGHVSLATVRFHAASMTIDVPIVADVAAWQGVTISFPARLIAAHQGTPVRIPWRLTNTGNAPDTISVNAVVSAGWTVIDAVAATPLGVHESVDGSTSILAPPRAQGLTTIRLIALSHGRPVAESSVDVLVAGGSTVAAGLTGPTLRAGFAMAAGPWPGTGTVQSLELQGPISDGLTVRARASSSPDQDEANYALSRAGIANMPFALQVAAPDWRLDAGTLGTSVSDLSGVNLVGRGASFVLARSGWVATGVAVSPDLGLVNTSGSLTGSRVEYSPGTWSVAAAHSHLRETRGITTRALDASTIGGSIADLLGGRLGAEVAHRRLDGTAAPGWSASYLRRTPDESIDFRYVHAPGGSRAFARATDELAINASRKLTERLHVTGGAWRSADDGTASFSALRMSGWTFGANLTLDDDLQLSITGHQSGFDASTSLGAFGSGERAVDAGLDFRRGAWSAQLTGNLASIGRTTTLNDTGVVVFRQSAPRRGVRGALALGGREAAAIAVTGQYQQTGPGVGAAPEQWSYGVRLDARPGFGYHHPLRLSLAAERVGGSIDAARSLMLHAGVELDLPLRSSLILSAERNPYVVPATGSNAWMYVVGISRALSLPRLSGRGTRGVVYRDVNGNGRRESGEPGFAGVMLRRGADVAVTDRHGAFTLPGSEKAPYELDARSLPVGWITPSTALPAGTRQIGALSVSPLEVELSINAADTARVPAERLADIVVTARDSTGREWASRRLSNTRLVFDALPPGVYTVVVDASGSTEPLRASGDLRAVVATGRARTMIRVVMHARQLRFPNQRRGS